MGNCFWKPQRTYKQYIVVIAKFCFFWGIEANSLNLNGMEDYSLIT